MIPRGDWVGAEGGGIGRGMSEILCLAGLEAGASTLPAGAGPGLGAGPFGGAAG